MIALMTMIAALAAADVADAPNPRATNTARNEHRFTLELSPTKGGWSAGATFTISACAQARCFHISGPIKLPSNDGGLAEGSFAIAELDCEIHFLEVPRGGMDSGDLRVTPISSDQDGKGCASLPAGLAGLYRTLPAAG
jgi:hypothetical protein